jgi:2-keto-3-deoxy-6-phosphogluconate aldolase
VRFDSELSGSFSVLTGPPSEVSLPAIPLIASGGVNQQNAAAAFIHAGAVALGIGRDLML